MVNDKLTDVPSNYKPFHDLYKEQMGDEKFKAEMAKMTWTGGKKTPGRAKNNNKKKKKKKK